MVKLVQDLKARAVYCKLSVCQAEHGAVVIPMHELAKLFMVVTFLTSHAATFNSVIEVQFWNMSFILLTSDISHADVSISVN